MIGMSFVSLLRAAWLLVFCSSVGNSLRKRYAQSNIQSNSPWTGWPWPASPWPLFQVDIDGRGYCGDVSLSAFGDPGVSEDLAVGPITSVAQTPACPISNGAGHQAGGHADAIVFFPNGRLGKLTRAFEVETRPGVTRSQINAGLVEYAAYMEMYCLKHLTGFFKEAGFNKGMHLTMFKVKRHPLRHFVGRGAWAPRFYGVCRKGDSAYLVLEDLGAKYKLPCILDLKLGTSTVEPNEQFFKRFKLEMRNRTVSNAPKHGAALVAYRIWNQATDSEEKSSKMHGPMTPLPFAFDKFFDAPGHAEDIALFNSFRKRLMSMAAFWQKIGSNQLRAIASSVLFMYECSPELAGKKVAKHSQLSLIDFAHFYPHPSKHTERWKNDGVHKGLLSAVSQLDRKILALDSLVVQGMQRERDVNGTTCPQGDLPHLTLKTCLEFGKRNGQKYLAWESTHEGWDSSYQIEKLGECRLCQVLSKKSVKPWLVFTVLDTAGKS